MQLERILNIENSIRLNAPPVASIIAWAPISFGDVSNGSPITLGLSLPESWKQCDGQLIGDVDSVYSTRHVPNLTDDRFLMGSNSEGLTGGTNNSDHQHTVPNHSHVGSTTSVIDGGIGSHVHSYDDKYRSGHGGGGGSDGWDSGESAPYLTTAGRNTGGPTNIQHSHSVTVGSGTNGDVAFSTIDITSTENRPSYFSVIYIIRIK